MRTVSALSLTWKCKDVTSGAAIEPLNRSSAFGELVRASGTRCAFICALAFVIGVTTPAEIAKASTDTQDCLAAIFSAAGKFANCRYKAEAKYLKSLDRPKQVADSAKCGAKLDSSVAKAYEKYGNACPDLSSTTPAPLRSVVTLTPFEEAYSLVVQQLDFALGWTQQQLISVVSDPGPETLLELPDPITYSLGSGDPDIIVIPARVPLCTTEGFGTASFTVVLSTAPTAPVTIPIASSNTAEGTVSPSITFTATDWNVPQTVTVTGVNDPQVDGDRRYRIVTGAASSVDASYDGMESPDIELANLDDDVAGVTMFPQSGLITSEAGGTTSFNVLLNTQPTAPVTIGIHSSNTAEGTVSPSLLTFTAADWNVPQTVTVTGVNDLVEDGNVLFAIVTSPATSSDFVYFGLDAADVSVLNLDNDPVACGTSDKCIFLTSAGSTGNLGGLAGADATCNALAGTAGLPGTYVAWLSDSTANAMTRVTSNGPYVTPAGDLVANSLADMTDGSLNTPIDDDENGNVVPLQEAWTGTVLSGAWSGSSCADWTDGTASEVGTVGHDTSTSSTWTDVFIQFCDHTVSLYCIQQ